MESQNYYRPIDLATAQQIQERLGRQSAYAHSTTERQGTEASSGLSEQPVPLLTAQEIMQLADEEILCFHRRLPPFQIRRMDWRQHPALTERRNLPPPQLQPLPQIADLPLEIARTFRFPQGYIDPDRQN
jgi:type IV secretory pathway TraG/TraD family ATPase VirD4